MITKLLKSLPNGVHKTQSHYKRYRLTRPRRLTHELDRGACSPRALRHEVVHFPPVYSRVALSICSAPTLGLSLRLNLHPGFPRSVPTLSLFLPGRPARPANARGWNTSNGRARASVHLIRHTCAMPKDTRVLRFSCAVRGHSLHSPPKHKPCPTSPAPIPQTPSCNDVSRPSPPPPRKTQCASPAGGARKRTTLNSDKAPDQQADRARVCATYRGRRNRAPGRDANTVAPSVTLGEDQAAWNVVVL